MLLTFFLYSYLHCCVLYTGAFCFVEKYGGISQSQHFPWIGYNRIGWNSEGTQFIWVPVDTQQVLLNKQWFHYQNKGLLGAATLKHKTHFCVQQGKIIKNLFLKSFLSVSISSTTSFAEKNLIYEQTAGHKQDLVLHRQRCRKVCPEVVQIRQHFPQYTANLLGNDPNVIPIRVHYVEFYILEAHHSTLQTTAAWAYYTQDFFIICVIYFELVLPHHAKRVHHHSTNIISRGVFNLKDAENVGNLKKM